VADEPETSEWRPDVAHAWSPVELKRLLEMEATGDAFLVLRDGDHKQRFVILDETKGRQTIGRALEADVSLNWDSEVSRIHTTLETFGGAWVVSDDGLSRNGTFVNAERVSGTRRLSDGDTIRCGQTWLLFRHAHRSSVVTVIGGTQIIASQVTPAQRRVLVALAAPTISARVLSPPASNAEIAAELFIGVDTVKSHLKALIKLFELTDLPASQKRLRLVEAAIGAGIVSFES
jgi:pSer/pThr/pTyr-binding forkhead associated (FHA) protein